jgi:hypothetical protein
MFTVLCRRGPKLDEPTWRDVGGGALSRHSCVTSLGYDDGGSREGEPQASSVPLVPDLVSHLDLGSRSLTLFVRPFSMAHRTSCVCVWFL